MTRLRVFALAALCFTGLARAADQADVAEAPSCKHCGMDRAKFAHSRMLIEYDDGTKVGLCSAHCTGVELAVALDKNPKSILVADQSSHELIDAEKAVWVVGGDVQGVMTKRAKWAFADQAGAESFVAKHGGEITNFDAIMKAAYEDMYEDTKMIRKKRQAMRAKAAGKSEAK